MWGAGTFGADGAKQPELVSRHLTVTIRPPASPSSEPSSSRSTSAASATGSHSLSASVRLPFGLSGIGNDMLVAGVELSASATAHLALLLERGLQDELAQRVGLAVDANAPGVAIWPSERRLVLAVLDDPNPELRSLRDALLRETDQGGS